VKVEGTVTILFTLNPYKMEVMQENKKKKKKKKKRRRR
jgi:hypothetical protein